MCTYVDGIVCLFVKRKRKEGARLPLYKCTACYLSVEMKYWIVAQRLLTKLCQTTQGSCFLSQWHKWQTLHSGTAGTK